MPELMSTKEQIVCAAERLFARHGIDGVSMREIGTAAGNANKSAVQYHFGSKDQLIQAIFEYRLPRLHERRRLLAALLEPADLRGWVECHVQAVLEQSEMADSWYMSFIAMLHEYGRFDLTARMSPELRAAASAVPQQLCSLLEHLPEPLRSRRVHTAMVLMVHVAASREHASAAALPVLPFAVELADLVDGMTGFLAAPASPASHRAAEAADLTPPPVSAFI
jgi:AcrR family transcriptional regulator